MTRLRVDLGEEIRHLKGLGVECAPDAAKVVADGFAETNGFGAVAAKETGLYKAFADFDDDIRRPRLLEFSRGPERTQDPLKYFVSCHV